MHSQAEFARALAAHGHHPNQATISRDLRELGVLKGPDGYELPRPGEEAGDPLTHLANAARQYLTSAVSAQNQVVVRTPPGGAQALALALDCSGKEELLGTLAGDDTILLIAKTAADAEGLVKWLETLA